MADKEYWIGPYNMRVPMWVKWVVAEDGGNTLGQNGSQTEKYIPNPMTEKEYLEYYAVLGEDGHYYWKE